VPSDDWSVVATFEEKVMAEVLLGLLEAEKLPARIASNEAVPGLGTQSPISSAVRAGATMTPGTSSRCHWTPAMRKAALMRAPSPNLRWSGP
jgi:hypothetical protein